MSKLIDNCCLQHISIISQEDRKYEIYSKNWEQPSDKLLISFNCNHIKQIFNKEKYSHVVSYIIMQLILWQQNFKK